MDGINLKTDIVLKDEMSEIERDMCAFGSIRWGECPNSYPINRYIIFKRVSTGECFLSKIAG